MKGVPFPIPIPFPLSMIEDFFVSLCTLFRGFTLLFPGVKDTIQKRVWVYFPIDVEEIFHHSVVFFQELRSCGPFTVVELDDGRDTKIHITLR